MTNPQGYNKRTANYKSYKPNWDQNIKKEYTHCNRKYTDCLSYKIKDNNLNPDRSVSTLKTIWWLTIWINSFNFSYQIAPLDNPLNSNSSRSTSISWDKMEDLVQRKVNAVQRNNNVFHRRDNIKQTLNSRASKARIQDNHKIIKSIIRNWGFRTILSRLIFNDCQRFWHRPRKSSRFSRVIINDSLSKFRKCDKTMEVYKGKSNCCKINFTILKKTFNDSRHWNNWWKYKKHNPNKSQVLLQNWKTKSQSYNEPIRS